MKYHFALSDFNAFTKSVAMPVPLHPVCLEMVINALFPVSTAFLLVILLSK